jgi:hypothetical protein
MESANKSVYKDSGGQADVGLIVDEQFYLHRLPASLK